MKMRFLALAAAAAALVSVPAHAQAEVVTNQLDGMASRMAERGFTPVDEAVRGTLAQGADEEFEVDLDGGVYVVSGFCDGNCSDLDLVLSTGDGTEVVSDRALDDYPVLNVDGRTGTLVLKVEMANCGADTCHYGVHVFRQR